MRKTKKIISGLLWAIVGLYVGVVVLLHVPAVQKYLGHQVSEALAQKLGTDVSVGRINLGLLNRVIIDDVEINDQSGRKMLNAARLSAKLDLLPLSQGRIVITSAQLFGIQASLYQLTPDEPYNFQFVLDSLASKDSSEHKPLDLKINSLVIRHGRLSFDKRYIAPRSGQFSPDHIHASNISAHVMLNALQDDSLNLNVKRLSLNEQSGIVVRNLKLKAIANRQRATLQDLCLELSDSKINIDNISATYRHEQGKFQPATLQFNGSISPSSITLSELTPFVPSLKDNNNKLKLSTSFSGTSTSLHIRPLDIESTDGSLTLHADGSISDWQSRTRWNAAISQLKLSKDGVQTISQSLPKNVHLPDVVSRFGDIAFTGTMGGVADDMSAKGILTSDAGQAKLALGKNGSLFTGHLSTDGLNLKQLLDNDQFGLLATDIDIDGQLPTKGQPNITAKGRISRFDYGGYTYQNVDVDGKYSNEVFNGKLNINDKNAQLSINGMASTSLHSPKANIVAQVNYLNPEALQLTNRWRNTDFSFNVEANFAGKDFNNANGHLDINNFQMRSPEESYSLKNLHIEAGNENGVHLTSMDSDFGRIVVKGKYDYASLPQSIVNLVASKLPTLPGISSKPVRSRNDFSIDAQINDSEWLKAFFDLPLTLHAPLHLTGSMNDGLQRLDMVASLSHFTYNDNTYRDADISVSTPCDTLRTRASICRIADDGHPLMLSLDANAINNHLTTKLNFENQGKLYMGGIFNADAQFFHTPEGSDAAHVDIHTSEIIIGDSVWLVEPGTVVYSKNDLTVDHLALKHQNQHLIVDGRATDSTTDTLFADLKDIDVKYILDLVNFHSVDFSGMATGRAFLTNVFNKPEASAHLQVNKFRFQDGRMGILTADAKLNNIDKQIDIHAVANDVYTPLQRTPFPQTEMFKASYTTVNGYVSPQRNEIELYIGANNTRGEFLESFCGSFMRDVDVWTTGNLRLYGPLSSINLTGEVVANGSLGIKSLNTSYTLRNDTIRLIPNEIVFRNDTIYDTREHIGIVNGALHHNYLKQLTYDIGIEAQNLLSFDFRDFGDDTFCGTVYGTGDCTISGRSGEVTIDVNVTPEEGSEIRYNAASPDAINTGEFITWNDRARVDSISMADSLYTTIHKPSDDNTDVATNIHLNLLINATQNATLKVIMDQQSGDYIALNGDGVIRATYYNKGAFDMFGNYNVDHGVYKLTIQNVIKKDFQFQNGGTIVFGGDPYNAALNLNAVYTVNGVSLSDLNIGRSFTSNNIRVNCLMNINGTPAQPRVEFGLDMPTVGTDAKQMIFSLINSEEEMNQQVLYLLAVGRFYNQNATSVGEGAQQSQTSLAMQSLLSGTISQQLNNVLSSVVKNNNWNFGANISTGDQGFYNAEYEGLLSGRLLNNRLLINGEFGYRDNPNATTSFIGDFDIRYLLRPNGNLAIKVYNQTNDRYFTRNSLNTQGIGLIMKKDFNGLRDLFGLKKSTITVPAPPVESSDSIE